MGRLRHGGRQVHRHLLEGPAETGVETLQVTVDSRTRVHAREAEGEGPEGRVVTGHGARLLEGVQRGPGVLGIIHRAELDRELLSKLIPVGLLAGVVRHGLGHPTPPGEGHLPEEQRRIGDAVLGLDPGGGHPGGGDEEPVVRADGAVVGGRLRKARPSGSRLRLRLLLGLLGGLLGGLLSLLSQLGGLLGLSLSLLDRLVLGVHLRRELVEGLAELIQLIWSLRIVTHFFRGNKKNSRNPIGRRK